MREKDKILYLESLRGIAALVVAIYHFNTGSLLNNAFTSNGWLMVDFFFVLSGFVIALNYQEKIKGFNQLYNFQARRFLRLYPLHILTLLIWLAIEIAKYVAESRFGLVANNPAFSTSNFSSFIKNVFLIQNLTGDALSWNRPSWSISAEFYTYIVFALVALLAQQKKLAVVFMSVVISAAAFSFLVNHSMATEFGFIRCLFAFFLGVLAFNFSDSFRVRIPNFVSYLMLVIAIVLVCISGGEYQIGINIFMPFFFLMLILSLVMSAPDNRLKHYLDNKHLVYLGTISYGIYMIHTAVWWAFTQVLRFVFEFKTTVGADGATEVLFDNAVIANLVILLGLAVIIVLAHFSYRFVEMPVNSFRHRLGRID